MFDKKKFFNSMLCGAIIGTVLIASMYFLLEWLNAFIAVTWQRENLLRLPSAHMIVLGMNLLLFSKWIRRAEKEKAAKGILMVSFLYTLFFFLVLEKNYSAL